MVQKGLHDGDFSFVIKKALNNLAESRKVTNFAALTVFLT